MKRFGTAYGGWHYPSSLPGLSAASVVLSAGVGEDISHDVLLSSILDCDVHLIDPTPRAIKHVRTVQRVLESRTAPAPNPRLGGGDLRYWDLILSNPCHPSHLKVHPYALAEENGTARFYTPANKAHVSHSLVPGMVSSNYIEVQTCSLTHLLQTSVKCQPSEVDLFKMDIEGAECAVISSMLAIHDLRPLYLAVEFDLWRKDQVQCVQTIAELVEHGYILIHRSGLNHVFVYMPKANAATYDQIKYLD